MNLPVIHHQRHFAGGGTGSAIAADVNHFGGGGTGIVLTVAFNGMVSRS